MTKQDYFRKTVCLDFDGCVHLYSKGWQKGDIYDVPVEGAFAAINELLFRHDKAVVIMSTRSPETIAAWMNERLVEQYPEFEYYCEVLPDNLHFWNGDAEKNDRVMVTNRKIPASTYIDDRALRFTGNWDEAVKSCLYPTTWQEQEEMTLEEWLELNNFKRNKKIAGQYDLKQPADAPEWAKDVQVDIYDDRYEDGLTRLRVTVFSPAGGLYDNQMDFKVRDAHQLDQLFTMLEL